MLDLCKLVFSHAEIMQISKEIIVLKDIFKWVLAPKDLKIQIFMIKKNEIWLLRYSHFSFISGHIGFMQMSL